MSSHSIDIISLGSLGYFAKISFPDDAEKATSEHARAKTIFVVDRSGSMGQHFCTVIRQVIPMLMKKLDYSDDEMVEVITFDSVVDSFVLPVSQFAYDAKQCRGCTTMAGIFGRLSESFERTPDNVSINLIVISDGEIGDTAGTIHSATVFAKQIVRSAPITVLPVRLRTSSGSNPDTKALACVALFNSSGPVPIIEFDIHNNRNLDELVLALAEPLQYTSVSYGTMTSTAPVFKNLPHTAPKLTLALSAKLNYVLLEPGTDFSEIFINDVPFVASMTGISDINSECEEIESEDDIKSFIDFVLSWLKIRLVVGQKDDDFMKVIQWFQALQQMLDSKVANAASSNVLMRDRVQLVKNSIKKRSSSLLNQILQLANASRVDNLNSNQMADYLRSNVKSKATAKRIEEYSGGQSLDDMAKQIFSNMFKIVDSDSDSNHDIGDGHISFLSQSGCTESLFAVKALGADAEVEIFDVLQLSGGVGLCFNSHKSDLPDPWQFRASRVYAGSLYLSEADLRTSHVLTYPGTDGVVSGVVPLMSLNPDLYKLYNFGSLRRLSELQAGVTMRGVVGSIPYDVLAMNAGVLVKLIEDIGPSASLSTVHTELVTGLIDQISAHISTYAAASLKDIADALTTPDPRPFLIGGNEANSVLKLCAVLFGHKICHENRQEAISNGTLQNIVSILYDLEAYSIAKHVFRESEDFKPPESRGEALQALLNIDLEHYASLSPVGELFEPDPDFVPVIKVDFEESVKRIPSWSPRLEKFASLYRWFSGGGALDSVGAAFGLSSSSEVDVMRLWVTANAINCKFEDDRVDKENGVALFPLPNSQAASECIQRLFDDRCRADFEKRIKQKRFCEAEIALSRLVQSSLAAGSEEEFVSLLNDGLEQSSSSTSLVRVTIRDRGSGGYEKIVTSLVDLSVDVKKRLKKINIVLTGRNSVGLIVWANGNVFRGNLDQFSSVFTQLNQEEIWLKIKAVIVENTKHTYRAGPVNRHGHGTEKPSYYALGFEKLSLFETACKEGKAGFCVRDWDKYVSEHKGCCGFPH